MVSVEAMSASDIYVTVTVIAYALTAAIAIGWAIDRWPEWTANHAEFMRDAQWRWACWEADVYQMPGTVWNPTVPAPRALAA